MDEELVEQLSKNLAGDTGLIEASKSPRHRFARILHEKGDEFNRVINFILKDSYMQPHLHPGTEKVEVIKILEGELEVIFFNDFGGVISRTHLKRGANEFIEVPAFQWHTYVMLTDYAITYETMMGIYDPETWKRSAPWAPMEGEEKSKYYLEELRRSA